MLNGLKPLLVSKGQAICYFIILDKTHTYFIKNNKIHIYFMKHHNTHSYFIKNNKKFYTPCLIYYRQPSCLWVHDASFFMWYNTSMCAILSLCSACSARRYAWFGVLFLKYKKFVTSFFKYKKFMTSFFKYKKFMGLLKPVSLELLGGDTPLKLRNSIKEMPLDIAKLSRRARMQHMHSISAYASHSNRCAGERHARNA